VLDQLGLLAQEEGDYEAARLLYHESLAIRRDVGDQWGIAWTLTHLGLLAQRQGEYGAARSLFEESLALWSELRNRKNIARSLVNLGLLATTEGDLALARSRHEESLAIGRELGDREVIATSLEGFADLAVARAQAERATRLYGAAERLREGTHLWWEDYCADYRRSMGAARHQLGEEAFAAARAAGSTLPLEQVITEALQAAPAS
jgi:tetratricopeptide (TPR) repeat protein